MLYVHEGWEEIEEAILIPCSLCSSHHGPKIPTLAVANAWGVRVHCKRAILHFRLPSIRSCARARGGGPIALRLRGVVNEDLLRAIACLDLSLLRSPLRTQYHEGISMLRDMGADEDAT